MTFDKYRQTISFLESFKNHSSERRHPQIYIKRTRALLQKLGHPEKSLKFIHVAGTSGKGSTCSLLQAALSAAGKRAGLLLSPHTTTAIERVSVNGLYISPHQFARLAERVVLAANDIYLHSPWQEPSYAEMILALGLLYFQEKNCRYVVLETGLGGRYDATNFITRSEISIITNVSLDHLHILGRDKQTIARDKAGIIKRNGVFLTAETNKKLLNIFKKICAERNSKFITVVAAEQKAAAQLWQQKKDLHNLWGEPQQRNLALATKAAEILGLPKDCSKRALLTYHLPCRLEIIQKKPLVIIDGAHNPAKIKNTAAVIKKQNFRRLFLIIAIAENKNMSSMLTKIIPLANKIFLTRFYGVGRRAAQPQKMARLAAKRKKTRAKLDIKLNPWHSLKQALDEASERDLILISGSLFLAGELRQHWISEEYILKHRRSF